MIINTLIHKNNSSMDAVPLDYRLFDPPPKQRKQQQQQSVNKTQSPKHHERKPSDECAKNSTNHTNLPGSISGKIRPKTTDNSSNSGNSLSGEFQCSPNGIPSPHIVQSGSYVEILKQAGNQAAAAAAQATSATSQHERLMSHVKNPLNSAAASLACHNKSYGDFLTITPRRKGKLLGGDGKSGVVGEGHDNYRHHLPHSIEPLHLLGIPNDNMSTFFDYRAMETLSNADTLAIGSTMSGHLYPSKLTSNKQQYDAAKTQSSVTAQVPDEYHHIISEKNLSPPSAFCDNISSMNKA
ncbi:hypothetical protein CVS40_9264 [Lucilia cuprina]|nr:hypothetical protein CVS40_9264 [Lucilia cuprina]